METQLTRILKLIVILIFTGDIRFVFGYLKTRRCFKEKSVGNN